MFFRCYHFPKRGKHSESNEGSGANDRDRSDSIWALIAGFAKNFGLTPKEVLDYTFDSIMLYSASLPGYDTEDSKDRAKNNDDEKINGDDPKNQQKLRELFFNA